MQVTDSLDASIDRAAEATDAAASTFLDPAFWIGLVTTAVHVVLILALAVGALALVRRIKKRWVETAMADSTTDKRRQRILTVADLLGSVARYVVWTFAAIMVLAEVGLDIGPLLAGAGIAGLALGFGAQTLVKDVISGFFLLFDDTLGYGDLIRMGEDVGTVEYVGLRVIKVRKFDGELLMIPAGELRTFGNKSIGFARAIVPVGLSYEQNVNEALAALEEVAREWAQSEHAQQMMLEEAPTVQALMDLADSQVTARVIVQVKPGEQFQAERDLRKLVKERFEEMGVEIPFPRRTVYVQSLSGDAPSDDDSAAAGAAD